MLGNTFEEATYLEKGARGGPVSNRGLDGGTYLKHGGGSLATLFEIGPPP